MTSYADFEAAGELDAIGAEIAGFKIGDAVSVLPAFDTSLNPRVMP